MCTTCIQEPEGAHDLLEMELEAVRSNSHGWALNLGSLKEQQALLIPVLSLLPWDVNC